MIVWKLKYTRIAIIILLVVGALAYFFIKSCNAFDLMVKSRDEDLPSTYQLSSNDSTIVAFYKNKYVVNEVKQSKVRFPISLITIDKRYLIVMTKFKMASKSSLTNSFRILTKNADVSTGIVYRYFDEETFRFRYKRGVEDSISSILFTVWGDSVNKIMENDNAIAYGLICKNLSLQFSPNAPVGVLIEANKKLIDYARLPLNILFLKKGDYIYLIVVTPFNSKDNIEPNFIKNLVEGALSNASGSS